MEHSESLTKLAGAMAKAFAEVENATKNAVNPHYRNNYADLPEVINTLRPVLAAHGLTLMQLPSYADGVAHVEGVLMHESGEWLSSIAGARVPKDDPQGVGSAITYLRRYQAAAMLFIGQEDDDGEVASKPQAPRRESVPTPEQHKAYDNPAPKQSGSILDALVGVGKHRGHKWGDLVKLQPDYVEWALENMNRLSADDKQTLRAALEKAKQPVPLSDPDDNLPF